MGRTDAIIAAGAPEIKYSYDGYPISFRCKIFSLRVAAHEAYERAEKRAGELSVDMPTTRNTEATP
jgi:hypothetical protein